ncbi:unnamed protein product [Gongylonema pulchrum]|uniref:Transcriptional regulator n=1 Tax=Gongylonema pulchrum TaxID=637853 RepID=A0A183EJX4_9BILA|nr:unnamed protein product [Gongylonema pulchrum]
MALQETDRDLQKELILGADIFEKLKKHEVRMHSFSVDE